MKFHSTILERTTQVHARALPGGLAKGCIYPIQSRYIFTHQRTAIVAQEHSAGARACLGRRCEMLRLLESRVLMISFRFFETEGIAIMTMLVSRYKIEVKEEPEFAGETFEERYARITAFNQGLTTM
jgi:hypothetical protein